MRLVRLGLLVGIPIAAALFSVAMGKDANWDFLNYRWYDPWALLHGRLTFDVLVAEHATFYNPLLELPFFLLATHVRAITAGFFLALAGSIAFVPLFLLSEQCLPVADDRRRVAGAAVVGLSGLAGGGVLGQIGVVSWDLPLATPTLFALWLLCRNGASALHVLPADSRKALLFAGLLAGGAAGLKLTAAIYPLGVIIALFIASQNGVKVRFGRTVIFGIGAFGGLILCGGYWMWRLYEAFGNPVFPYFNGAFHSAYAVLGSNRDAAFLPHGWHDILLFPVLFTADSLRVAEYHFRDVHIALAWTLGLIATALSVIRWAKLTIQTRFLFVFAAIAFIAWESLFAIYRYILPLEMLCSLLIVLAILSLPLPGKSAPALAALVLIVAQCLISAGWDRKPWEGNYVEVDFPFAIPQQAMVILTGNAPMGFAVTALPTGVFALRIGSYLAAGNLFATVMRQKVARAPGPFYALFAPGDETASVADLFSYGLIMDPGECEVVTSNVSHPLKFCPVTRK